MREKLDRRASLNKVSLYAIGINSMEILAVLLLGALLFRRGADRLTGGAEAALIAITALIVISGAVMDIREAFMVRRVAENTRMLEEAYSQLEALNGTLRAQRHDFKNHMQVILSLSEMGEYEAMMDYIQRLSDDLMRVGAQLKTRSPAVNALLAAKQASLEAEGILLQVNVRSDWAQLPATGWEMCRVLGNLIDNAREAIATLPSPRGHVIEVALGEAGEEYTFTVRNNGPAIPPEVQAELFRPGFTTKQEGHGFGLAIVQEILEEHGGHIEVHSDESWTSFCGALPIKKQTGES